MKHPMPEEIYLIRVMRGDDIKSLLVETDVNKAMAYPDKIGPDERVDISRYAFDHYTVTRDRTLETDEVER